MKFYLAILLVLSGFPAFGLEVPACRVSVNMPDGGFAHGSGVVVARDDRAIYIATNHHVVADGNGTAWACFVKSEPAKCRVILSDQNWDMAVLECTKIGSEPVEVASDLPELPELSENVIGCGFGGGNFAEFKGAVVGFCSPREGVNQFECFDFQNANRQGDSGGPVFDSEGRLVGLMRGHNTQDNTTNVVPATRLTALCQTAGIICGPCRNGVCPIPRMRPVQQQQQAMPIQRPQQPATIPNAVQPQQKPCQCDPKTGDRLIAIEQKISAFEASIEAGQMAGKDGKDGRDGKDAEPIDLDALAAKLSDKVGCKCKPQEPTPQPKDEQHVVVVADQNSPYWQRLSAQIDTSKKTYHGIQVAPLPNFPIGQHPQLVVYRNSVPVRVVKGQYEVEALLSRLARGESV